MILAAGRGTRVKPITNHIPKPLIPIIDKPVVEFLVELLVKHGIKEVMLNISHLGWKIQEFLGDGYKYGVHIGYSFEGHFDASGNLITEPIGSAGGMKRIQQRYGFFDETFIVLCGDAIVDLDITKALDFHRSHNAMATIITKEVSSEMVSNYGIVVTDDEGRIKSFQEKPSAKEALSRIANTGIYIFEPEVLENVPDNTFYDIGSQLFPALVKAGAPIYAVNMDFQWLDIGRTSDYLKILEKALKGEINEFEIHGKRLSEGLWIGAGTKINPEAKLVPPVWIGPAAVIEEGVEIIGPAMIGANAFISKGTAIKNSYIMDYVKLLPGITFEKVLISPEYFVKLNGESGRISGSFYGDFVKDVRSEP
ncbi:sugar phosphate nucleotidyltransferase [Kosmotoga arenicorallina]|nr:NDP-sugar synthase [Kosmotoga arenicorallina]